MTQLYYCNATCDENQLISYATPLVELFTSRDTNMLHVGLYRFPSSTSAQHLRKYVKWLREHNENAKATLLAYALDTAVAKHIRHCEAWLNLETGELEFENDDKLYDGSWADDNDRWDEVGYDPYTGGFDIDL
jgi:hypothetical protein